MWVVVFFNTGIVLYLVNASFKKLNLDEDDLIGGGKYPDFTGAWYTEVGATIFITTFIAATSSSIANVGSMAVKIALRYRDRGFTKDKKRTKKLL
jgi:hypothetical protein